MRQGKLRVHSSQVTAGCRRGCHLLRRGSQKASPKRKALEAYNREE